MFWTFVAASRISEGRIEIDGAQGHHLARVLRVRPGEHGVAVSDGREYELEVVETHGDHVVGRVVGERPAAGEAATRVTLLQAVLPNPDFDAVIEAGTAVGIRGFVAVQATRSIGQPAESRKLRWRAIAQSAAEQSHRGEIPEVTGPMDLPAALDHAAGTRLLALDPTASLPLTRAVDGSPAYTIAVGPEGGWTEDELTALRASGALAVNLGPRILRARLAPIVAAAILVQHR
jgi:16S rRNA (uracil1498-N3)-methyltransferase